MKADPNIFEYSTYKTKARHFFIFNINSGSKFVLSFEEKDTTQLIKQRKMGIGKSIAQRIIFSYFTKNRSTINSK